MANPSHNKQTTNRRGAMGGGMMKRTGYKSGSLKNVDKNKVTRGDIITAAKKNKGKA